MEWHFITFKPLSKQTQESWGGGGVVGLQSTQMGKVAIVWAALHTNIID